MGNPTWGEKPKQGKFSNFLGRNLAQNHVPQYVAIYLDWSDLQYNANITDN